jgi:hypothetical protein
MHTCTRRSVHAYMHASERRSVMVRPKPVPVPRALPSHATGFPAAANEWHGCSAIAAARQGLSRRRARGLRTQTATSAGGRASRLLMSGPRCAPIPHRPTPPHPKPKPKPKPKPIPTYLILFLAPVSIRCPSTYSLRLVSSPTAFSALECATPAWKRRVASVQSCRPPSSEAAAANGGEGQSRRWRAVGDGG